MNGGSNLAWGNRIESFPFWIKKVKIEWNIGLRRCPEKDVLLRRTNIKKKLTSLFRRDFFGAIIHPTKYLSSTPPSPEFNLTVWGLLRVGWSDLSKIRTMPFALSKSLKVCATILGLSTSINDHSNNTKYSPLAYFGLKLFILMEYLCSHM